jgi:hypothetical protein
VKHYLLFHFIDCTGTYKLVFDAIDKGFISFAAEKAGGKKRCWRQRK